MLNFVVPATTGKARCNFNHANTGTGRIASSARFARSLANIIMQTLSCGKDHKVRKGNCQLCRRWLRQDAATSFAQTLERHRSQASQGSQGTLRTQGSHSKLQTLSSAVLGRVRCNFIRTTQTVDRQRPQTSQGSQGTLRTQTSLHSGFLVFSHIL